MMSCCDTKQEAAAASNCNGDKATQTTSARNETGTTTSKVVPLSLSSLAHMMCLPRSDGNLGVLEGLLSVVHHTLLEVSSHESAPIRATSWTLTKEESNNSSNGSANNEELKVYPHAYAKHSFLYSGKEPLLEENVDDWASTLDASVVGRISLYYASSQDISMDDDEGMQQAIFTKSVVEYRSQRSKGTLQARTTEELSLTSFGNGSVDDNVKLGALSSLHDECGKYVLKITSVRDKTYCYNVCDTTMACVTVANQEPHKGPPLTRLELTLVVKDKHADMLRPLSFPSTQLEHHFLVWDTPVSATAHPSHQTLLLEKQGMYINGRLMKHAELLPALFGFNLDGIPAWHGRIQDYEMVKQAYATLWQEVMIDARLVKLNIASTLLDRLMNGGIDDDDDDNDDDEDDTNKECLESHLMASTLYDPVGICAKALATRFAQEFGKSAVPCLAHEVEWYQNRMGDKTPVVVPQRVINVLRRGGYFDLQRDTNEVWFMENVRSPAEGKETKAVDEALELLREAGCEDAPKIMFVKIDVANPVKNKYICRYNDALVQYHVNEAVWDVEKPAVAIAMYVAQECPDGNVLLNLISKRAK